jgi:RNA polymerase sigma-70 factor, ECF subfamily
VEGALTGRLPPAYCRSVADSLFRESPGPARPFPVEWVLTSRRLERHTMAMGREAEAESDTRERLARFWGGAEAAVQAFVFSAVDGFQHAEDVVQDVALTVARRFHEYDPARPFVAWAIWLAKSRVVDHYRKRGRERRQFSDVLIDRLAEVIARQAPERSARQVALEHCLEKLPERSRRLLDLRYVEGGSAETIAQAIQSTSGSVRVTLHRIRDVLADCIRARLAAEGGG